MKARAISPLRWRRVRVFVLGVLMMAGCLAVVGRAYHLQIAEASSLRSMAEDQYLRHVRVAPRRGTIYDRHGAELAVSVDVDSVFVNPRRIRASGQDARAVAKRLAEILDVPVKRVTKRLGSDSYFAWIKRHVTPAQAQQVRELEIPGVALTSESKRFYPNVELAAQLLGFVNVDGRGIEGVELAFEDKLRGADRRVSAIRDSRGRIVFSDDPLIDPLAQGHDIFLTIDKTIQHIAERELGLAVRTFEAKGGSAVVLDPSSGELLAVANYPPFNPNEPGSAPTAYRRNRAITDRFEPGSTIKPFTIAAALKAEAIEADQIINCGNGSWRLPGATIHDVHPYGDLAPTQILQHSSNIGVARVAQMLGKRGLYTSFRRLGFGQPTGVGLPGEAAGVLRHHRGWYDIDLATVSFGQGMSVTNLQLSTAWAALANDGQLMRPMMVSHVTDGAGNVVEDHTPHRRHRALPPSIARLVTHMLTTVTEAGGTGIEASIDGYLVAGKTGTAQKPDHVHGGYAKDRWISSFIGFVPADNPRLVISVSIDEPQIAHYGGTVAGPAFRRIGEQAMRHLGVPPRRRGRPMLELAARSPAPPEKKAPTTQEPPVRAGYSRVPDLRGEPLRVAMVELHGRSLVPKVRGSGSVVRQSPRAGEIVRHGSEVRVVLTRDVRDEQLTPVSSPPMAHAGAL